MNMNHAGKTFLVTGAAGFIGSKLAQRLVDSGASVVTVDNLSTGHEAVVPRGVEFIKGGCHEPETIARLGGRKFDAIFHLAGQSGGEPSFDDPVYDLQANVQSTLLLLKYCVDHSCGDFLYASSMSVYGDWPDRPAREDEQVSPKSFYAVGKLASEHYMRIYSKFGVRCTALRIFPTYGPGQNMENLRQGMVSIFLAQALQKGHIHVKGSPDRFRDLLYIDDCVDLFVLCYEKKGEPSRVYNAAPGRKIFFREVVEGIIKRMPTPVTCEYKGATPGDTFGIYADVSKVKAELGWAARVYMDEGLDRFVRWALGQKAG